MRSNRRRNWFIKRIALGLAIAAFAAPVAQAKLDESSPVQSNGYKPFVTDFGSQSVSQVVQAHTYQPANAQGSIPEPRIEFVRQHEPSISEPRIEFIRTHPRSINEPQVVAADYGMPRAMPNDYALSSGDQIEVVRAQPQGTSSDKIEFVRTQPRSIGEPQVVAAGFDWKDAGIGAGLALALVLLGGGAALASRHVGRAQTA
jgi:hypothetical protein